MNTKYHSHKRTGKVWVGFIILMIGIVLLFQSLGFHLPDWIISWPMLLIVIGLIQGSRHNFKHPIPIVLILIGGAFLLEDIIPGFEFHSFVWPLAIIILGLYLIVGRGKSRERSYSTFQNVPPNGDNPIEPEPAFNDVPPADVPPAPEDFIDAVSVFGGIKKNVVSKSFRGGEIVTIMGGAEINLTQADFTGPVVLEVVQIFGGTKIILPSNWKVSSEMAAIFGGIEDKRMIHPDQVRSDKTLVIRGTSIFGGVTIHSF